MRLIIFAAGSAMALAVVVILVMIRLFHRKLAPGQALVITSTAGGRWMRVSFTSAIVLPIVHRSDLIDITVKTVEVSLDGEHALISKDGVRIGIKASFYIQINQTQEDVLKVAQSVGCEQASDPAQVRALFRPKCVEALRTVARILDFKEMQLETDLFRDEVLRAIGRDLNGFTLADAAVEQIDRASNKPADEAGPFR
jgi:uncharacterized membrane protein YqiK